jgi:hypothetical protein
MAINYISSLLANRYLLPAYVELGYVLARVPSLIYFVGANKESFWHLKTKPLCYTHHYNIKIADSVVILNLDHQASSSYW